MNNTVSFEHVRMVAQAILNRLGHHAPQWAVLDVAWAPEFTLEPPEASTSKLYISYSTMPALPSDRKSQSHLSVVLGSPREDREESVTAYYSLNVPTANAIAELASQIQDHAIEISQGSLLPPCPGHNHPLSAHVVEGVAVWECPKAAAHYSEPIV